MLKSHTMKTESLLVYVVCLVLGSSVVSYGQSIDTDIQFLPVEQKFSQNTISAILEDEEGFLWLGTRKGLDKYDGINVWKYQASKNDSSSIPNSYIEALYETKDGTIWVGTLGGGLSKFDKSSMSFTTYNDRSAIKFSGKTVTSVLEDSHNNLWIGTENNGLYYFDRANELFIQYRQNDDDPFSISGNNVTGLVQDKKGNIWIGTWGGGLNLFNPNTKRFIRYLHHSNNPGSLRSDVVRSLHMGSNGNVWVGTNKGICKVRYDQSGKYIFESVDIGVEEFGVLVVLTLMEDSKNRLWVGTENNGVCVLDINTDEFRWYTYDPGQEYSIKNNSIWSIYEDRSGVVWIGTFNKGLFKVDFNQRKFLKYQHHPYNKTSLSNSSVSSFAEDNKGNIWVGTDGGGLDYWERETNIFKHYNKSNKKLMANEVLFLHTDRQENLWIGTWNGGVYLKKRNSEQLVKFPLEHEFAVVSGKENVLSIAETKDGKMWFAIFRAGLLSYDTKTKKFQSYLYDERNQKGISSFRLRTLYEDSKGVLWVGTEDRGLNRAVFSPEGIQFVKYQPSPNDKYAISDNSILSFHESDDGTLWIGTAGGLNQYLPEKDGFLHYDLEFGLPDEVIYGIEEDEYQNLWLSSNQGIIRFNINDKSIRSFDLIDGVQSMEFFKQASYKLKDGHLLFGGINGFNLINPKDVLNTSSEPEVYLVDFKISNESVLPSPESVLDKNIKEAEKIKLKYDQNDFSFEFSQINFSQSSKNIYSYQLVNYDSKWQEAGNRREAYYTNVPSGTYEFRVRSTNNEGNWSTNEASILIEVLPAWYNTYWAYIIYVLIIIGLLIWAFQTLINRERLQTKLQVEHLELSKMQELDEMKSSFFANISHEFRSPLTLILGPLKAIKENPSLQITRDQAGIMLRNSENLLNLINQLLELSKLESGKMRLELVTTDIVKFLKPVVHSFSSMANRRNIAYKINAPKEPVQLSFDKDKLEKIIVNLLSNAFKYTNDFGKIELSLIQLENKIVIHVIDDGIGISEDNKDFIFNRYYRVRDKKKSQSKGTGIGLSLTKELVELHKGHIDFESEEDQGTTFSVHLFTGTEHLDADDFVDEQVEANSSNQGLYELDENINKSVEVISGETETENSKAPLVLIIEDNDDIREYIKTILITDYNIIEADNGLTGFDLAINRIPDLIISDIMMPGLDGFEVCKKVKSNLKTSHIPVVLLTAKASNDSALDGFEIGADYYITKPFNPRLLALRVRNVLKIKNQIREQLLSKSTLDIEPKDIKIASKDESFIEKAVGVIEENISNSDFFVDDLGRELGLSRMQLYRKLKGLIGQSANEFIRSIRLKRAAQLLKQDQMTISEITYHVGFNDLQYFRDCFKKQFGVNPSEYAQDIKEKIQ